MDEKEYRKEQDMIFQELQDREDIEKRREKLSIYRDKRALDELERVAKARGISIEEMRQQIASGHPDGKRVFGGFSTKTMMTLAEWVRQRRAEEDSK